MLDTDGDIELAAPQVMVTVALADLALSATLVAVTVTVDGAGTVAGAVYSAVVALLDAINPTVEFPPAALLTLQVTSALWPPFPVTVAVNSCAPPVVTLALVGAIIT
ncbi:MAG: hypothetical protein ACRD4R_12130 [Candidatus Acidiferrales bacterium]